MIFIKMLWRILKMAKRDKNRSFSDWEEDWGQYEDDSKKELQRDRRNKRNKKYNSEDWDELSETSNSR